MAYKSAHQIRIVTCCYCGARSTIGAKGRRALVCHGCGAPITKIESLQPALERVRKSGGRAKPAIPHQAELKNQHADKDRPYRRRKGKYRKRSIWYHVSEAFDDLDDLFDIFD